MLTGSFPSLVNNVTGTIAWPNQALVPTYSWMNTQNTNSYATNHFWQTYESPARVTENTDYYNQYPNVDNGGSFTGAAGTGYGTRASRPSTCTTGVAYWSTDQGSWNQSGSGGQGVLDECTSTNTWTNAAYTPYTYPDPLEGGSSPVTSRATESIWSCALRRIYETDLCSTRNSGARSFYRVPRAGQSERKRQIKARAKCEGEGRCLKATARARS